MIRYTPEALDDLERLHAWQLARSVDLANRFLDRLGETEARIARHPAIYPRAASGEARKCLMRFGRYAYVIYYVIEGEDQVIVRMWHGREDRR